MKFSFLLLLTSNTILATSATYHYKHILCGEGPVSLYERTVREEHLNIENFGEAMKKLENDEKDVERDYARRLNRHLFGRLGLYRFKCKTIQDVKYETYKDRMVEMAKWADNHANHASFLVVLEMYRTYLKKVKKEAKKNGDHNSLGLLRRDKIEIFLTAAAEADRFKLETAAAEGDRFKLETAAAEGYRFKLETLLAFGKLDESVFPELMDKAAAQGLDWVVEFLLQQDRAKSGLDSLWQNIKSGTTLPDLVGTHLLEYAKKEIGTSADDQETANDMLFATLEYDGMNHLRFLALLDKADKKTRDQALCTGMGKSRSERIRPFVVAVLLAYGKLDGGHYYQTMNFNPETEVVPELKEFLLKLAPLGLV